MYYIAKLLKKLRLSSMKGCRIHPTAKICGGCELLRVSMGRYSYIGYGTTAVETEIGAFCAIAGDCQIGGGRHPLEFVSISPVFYKGKNILGKHFAYHEFHPYTSTYIGNDVWIGQGARIKGGVRIGNGAVVGMGAVVTKNIGPYEIWAGNPARFIRKRFDDEAIILLERGKWWEWEEDKLRKYGSSFDEIRDYLLTEEPSGGEDETGKK